MRPGLHSVLILLIVLAVAMPFVAEASAVGADPVRFRAAALGLYALAGVVWLTGSRHEIAARWIATAALAVGIPVYSTWLAWPPLVVLSCFAVGLASLLIGLPAAVAVTVCQTALLVPGVRSVAGVQASMAGVAVTGGWLMLALMVGVYYPIQRTSKWQLAYFERARGMLEDARNQKARVEQALEDLANANRQLGLANERMATLRAIAEDAQKTKMMFVAKVSHEFRTPLNMITGLVSLMTDNSQIYTVALPPEMREDLRIVHRNSQHLSNMIDDVLSLTQIDAGRLVLRKERVDIGELVEAATDAVGPLIEKKGLILRKEVPSDLPRVYCDRVRIQQVVLNLLSNAARFTEQGSISVTVEGRNERVLVSVADTGPGIAPDHAEHIFEPFNQGTSELWRDKAGTGLGLTISKQYLEHHGGRMWFESELGSGATFRFELPVTTPLEHSTPPSRWIREDWAWRERSFRTDRAGVGHESTKPRLVLCDETGLLQREFTRWTDDLEVVNISSVERLLAEGQPGSAHVVVLSVTSPQDLLRAARKAARQLPTTPVVACSVHQVDRASAAGAQIYLTKPVTQESLKEAINACGRPVKRVMVVDDDPDVLRLLTRMLNACDLELEVETATEGEKALYTLRVRPADLVLLDLMLPHVDGWEWLERKNRDDRLRDIPVVIVSALDPLEEPLTSPLLVLAQQGGLSMGNIVDCSLQFAAMQLHRGSGLDPEPARSVVAAPVSGGNPPHPEPMPTPLP